MDYNKFGENGRKLKLTKEKKREIINICKDNNVQKSTPFSLNFKRITAAVCVLIIAVTAVFVYKNHNDDNDIPIHSATEQSEITFSKAVETTFVQSSQKIENTTEGDGIGGGDLGLLKYRMDYYNIPAPFANLVEAENYDPWYDEIALENPNETNVMVMKKFIQHFNISREDFDKANLEWAKIIIEGFDGVPMMNPQDFENQETDEVYNADIIYTFDDEIINNYYLSHSYPFVYADEYEDAVANGTYQTRTTDWIDIDQMEADLIAKYGETEIVTEVTTVPEEIVTTDLSQIETIE